MKLVHAPGETNDQLFVWLPDKRVLMPGDNVYKAFPNLYTIRGTLYRDLMDWVASLDAMRALAPEHLVPSHTRPVSGRETVAEILTAYRDAIQFVHDQTIRGMNRGLTPDELARTVVLPPHLRNHPYLRELYGSVEWSVRSVFTGYLGWFDGDASTLSPASPAQRARGFVELAGSEDALLAAARRAYDEERFAWAAELAAELRRAQTQGDQRAGGAEARQLEADALRALGQRSISPNGRNYYLTQALELEGEVIREAGIRLDDNIRRVVAEVPIRNFIAAMPVNLDPEKAGDEDVVVGFRFPDVGREFTIHVRRGVAEFQEVFPESPDLSITTDSHVWREIILGARNPAVAFASGDVEIEGGVVAAVRFLGLFR